MLAISVDSGRHVSLSLSHQGSGFERFGRAQGLCDRMSSGIFPDGLEGWRRPKAKNKATEDPFLVQRTDNICLQLEPSSGAQNQPDPQGHPKPHPDYAGIGRESVICGKAGSAYSLHRQVRGPKTLSPITVGCLQD